MLQNLHRSLTIVALVMLTGVHPRDQEAFPVRHILWTSAAILPTILQLASAAELTVVQS
jgi:hypothetical protein